MHIYYTTPTKHNYTFLVIEVTINLNKIAEKEFNVDHMTNNIATSSFISKERLNY